jgi:hypothetical protein
LIGEGAGGEVVNLLDSIMGGATIAPKQVVEDAGVVEAQTIESKPNTDFDIHELMNEFMMD